MNNIAKILGTGCSNCRVLERVTLQAIQENSLNIEVQKVEDLQSIMAYGIMRTPALVLNEKVLFSGRVPTKTEIKNILEKEING
jgi:small redox-active disulfide protein 2